MAVLEDTKQQITDRLNDEPAEKLGSVLDFAKFVSLDEDRKDWSTAATPVARKESSRRP